MPLACPDCGSEKVWKDGIRKTFLGPIQRYICRDCGRRFSDSEKMLKNHSGIQYSALMEVKKEKQEVGTREAATDTRLFNFSWELKKEGLKESTIHTYVQYLTRLKKRGADLFDPESVKDVIARQKWSEKTKALMIAAYSKFLEVYGGVWKPPKVRPTRKLPFIPTEKELDALISGAGKKMACFLQLLKETGMRAGEAHTLKWTSIDFEAGTLTLNDPLKSGKPRIFKLSSRLLSMLNMLPKKDECIFAGKLSSMQRNFIHYRKRMAQKLQNPRLNRISFHTFRHWKATMEYHKTKDILYVKELLGHKAIVTTLLYTQLVNFREDEYAVRVSRSIEEDKELLAAGFEYVTERDGIKIYRKRK